MIFHEDVVDLTTPTGPMRTHILHPVAPGQYPGILFYSGDLSGDEPGTPHCGHVGGERLCGGRP